VERREGGRGGAEWREGEGVEREGEGVEWREGGRADLEDEAEAVAVEDLQGPVASLLQIPTGAPNVFVNPVHYRGANER
jgi:hypothetical protein